MQQQLGGYAREFNRRHRRHGHLLQNRCKSILVEEEAYLLELVRYIHINNPLRAGLVSDAVHPLDPTIPPTRRPAVPAPRTSPGAAGRAGCSLSALSV
jgi:hypothetical protein